MKNFWESLKDVLYESMDYIIMLTIIIGVVSIIGWRLDILFAKDAEDPTKTHIISEDTTLPGQDIEKDIGNSGDNEEVPPEEDPQASMEDDEEEEEKDTAKSITVDIPDGSLPSTIGSILESNGLVDSKNEFVQKAQDMDLDRHLRSGNYTIEKDSSLEDIVKIIARQR